MKEIVKVIEALLDAAELVTFEYSTEFVLGFQRRFPDTSVRLREMFGEIRVPLLFNLRFRGTWYVGDRDEWLRVREEFPYKGSRSVRSEAPLQAALLTKSLGLLVSSVQIRPDGSLTLVLTDGTSLSIDGTGGDWHESWFLELPSTDPDRNEWSITCDSDGSLRGYYPGASRNRA